MGDRNNTYVQVRDKHGYIIEVQVRERGALFDKRGYNVGKVNEEKALELKLAQIRKSKGETQRNIPGVDWLITFSTQTSRFYSSLMKIISSITIHIQ